jgi:hypothetical protein
MVNCIITYITKHSTTYEDVHLGLKLVLITDWLQKIVQLNLRDSLIL